jgi:phosphoribosylformylglycinamidine synthase
VLRPRLDSDRGIAVGCGLAPHLSDRDPYWMALAGMDEAIRNIVCVGGDPSRTAVLDNFCWGRTDDPRQLGGLVRACQACYDGAMAYGTPFISGKDSLNNEFALDERDVEPLLQTLREMAQRDDADAVRLRRILPAIEQRMHATRRLGIPGTLLISAVAIVPDVNGCVTPDLKQAGDALYLVGAGLPLHRASAVDVDGMSAQAGRASAQEEDTADMAVPRGIGFSLAEAARIHRAIAGAIAAGMVRACHDVSDGGWLAALAEMCLSAGRGADVSVKPRQAPPAFDECCAGYVIEAADAGKLECHFAAASVGVVRLGEVADGEQLRFEAGALSVSDLHGAWSGRRDHAASGES